MKTFIKTAHEEEYSNKSNALGVLLNVDESGNRVDSLVYIYRDNKKLYIFFNTITDMNEFLLYGDGKMQRAYVTEEDFDAIYDLGYIEGKISDQLVWSTKNASQN